MKHPATYYLYRVLLTPLAWLPLRCLYGLAAVVYAVLAHVMHYRRTIIEDNLRRVFPEKSEAEREAIKRRYYHFLADVIVEIVKMLHFPEREVRKRVKVVGAEICDRHAAEGHPVFIMMGHYGNWEWAQSTYDWMPGIDRHTQIYRPVHDAAMDALMLRARGRFRGICIPQGKAMREILRMSKEGVRFCCAFLSDQHPNSEKMRNWTTFLGQDSAYVTGAEDIGQRIGARYVYLDIERTSRGHYTMTFSDLHPLAGEEDHPWTKAYLVAMEASIRRQPELWLWSHRRWLYDRAGYEQHMREFHELQLKKAIQ